MTNSLVTALIWAGMVLILWLGSASGQNYIIANEVAEDFVKCYECNVWKAGYGQECDNPRIRPNCYACLKVETVIFMGYYKSTPRSSNVTTRACANSKSVPFFNECQYFTTVDGHSRRCYCKTDLCNSSTNLSFTTTGLLASLISLIFLFMYTRDIRPAVF